MKNVMAFLGCLFLLSCSNPSSVFYPTGDGIQKLNLSSVLQNPPTLGKGEIKVEALGDTGNQSTHLVWIKTHEAPHLHAEHDLTVLLLKGQGVLEMGKEKISLKTGDLVSIPRKTVHAFTNGAPEAALAFVVFSPSFDGQDVVPAETSSAPSK